jgi:hypothetical protein
LLPSKPSDFFGHGIRQSQHEFGSEQSVELVDWEGEDDPENPQNWPTLWKWGNIGLISMITIITYEQPGDASLHPRPSEDC